MNSVHQSAEKDASRVMEWWQCFVDAGTFACLVLLVRMLQKDTIYLAQEAKYDMKGVVGRVVSAVGFQFILWGTLIGTPVWFGYRLIS